MKRNEQKFLSDFVSFYTKGRATCTKKKLSTFAAWSVFRIGMDSNPFEIFPNFFVRAENTKTDVSGSYPTFVLLGAVSW